MIIEDELSPNYNQKNHNTYSHCIHSSHPILREIEKTQCFQCWITGINPYYIFTILTAVFFSQKLALNHFLLRDEIISRTCYLYYSQLARLELCFQLHQSLITLKIIIVPAICLTLFPYQIFYSRLLVYSLYCRNSYLIIEQI